ncbi:MAG: hypothetical protein M0011_01905 [Elusimicrobia bacterium]|nr:hypothetical protein [Elusimicrobiota bacterium]
MKPAIMALMLCTLTPAAAVRAAASSADEVSCAAEDMQLFYYYLAPQLEEKVKSRKTDCHGSKTTLELPGWLEKARPAMLERKVWRDPEEGELSEAALWQTPVSVLYEFASKAQRGADPLALEAEYADMRVRFMMSLDRLYRSGLQDSMGGRGAALLADMDGIMKDFDGIMEDVSDSDRKGFDARSADLLRRGRALFARLFEAPRQVKDLPKRYKPVPYILAGYRGVTLPVSGPQALFLNPGDRADMLVTFEAIMAGDVKEKVTATILQNVLVTKVQKPDSPDGVGAVQMLVNPMEGQYASLSLAQASNIVLTRRAAGDMEMHPMEIASFRKLLK